MQPLICAQTTDPLSGILSIFSIFVLGHGGWGFGQSCFNINGIYMTCAQSRPHMAGHLTMATRPTVGWDRSSAKWAPVAAEVMLVVLNQAS